MNDGRDIFLGIDIGTSGCRIAAIDISGNLLAEERVAMTSPLRAGLRSEQSPALWWQTLRAALAGMVKHIAPEAVRALAIDGTSGTLLLADERGEPLGPALMYDDARSQAEAAHLAAFAAPESAAHGASSALAKLLHLQASTKQARYALHQADWLASKLSGQFGISDENNCLKLGYDPVRRMWPEWIAACDADMRLLPHVVPPGSNIGTLQHPELLALGYSPQLRICAGTTDGVAAFIATGANVPGDAVTSLGSTLVVKLLSQTPVFAPAFGIYSHRLGELWLAGGASNSGGAVLLHHFTIAQMEHMDAQLNPDAPTNLDYYPLTAPGERFPHNNPTLMPHLTPRPSDDIVFYQAMLEGIARIEALGYQRLEELGAPAPKRLMTVGGSARSSAWTRIRARILGIPFTAPRSDQAAYGAALIAAGIAVQRQTSDRQSP
ncbi:MAG: FGGY-family carbohydrate kinase [Chromatiales bacterium]|nr:FGGY-family carbohydrate kinase [Chromatiales bacterium]